MTIMRPVNNKTMEWNIYQKYSKNQLSRVHLELIHWNILNFVYFVCLFMRSISSCQEEYGLLIVDHIPNDMHGVQDRNAEEGNNIIHRRQRQFCQRTKVDKVALEVDMLTQLLEQEVRFPSLNHRQQ